MHLKYIPVQKKPKTPQKPKFIQINYMKLLKWFQ